MFYGKTETTFGGEITEFNKPNPNMETDGVPDFSQEVDSHPGSPVESHSHVVTPEEEKIMALLAQGRNVFITGPAGTGKSALLNKIQSWFMNQGKKVVVCAPTGVASLNIRNGVTIHSAFRINPMVIQSLDDFRKTKWAVIGSSAEKDVQKNGLSGASALILDEVSMVSADLFEKMDVVMRMTSKRNMPFGGIHLVLFGDFLQLGPVYNRQRDPPRQAHLACRSHIWDKLAIETIVLQRVFRQRDPAFRQLVAVVRAGGVPKGENAEILGAMCKRRFDPKEDDSLLITVKKSEVDKHNNFRLKRLLNRDGIEPVVLQTPHSVLSTAPGGSQQRVFPDDLVDLTKEVQKMLSPSSQRKSTRMKIVPTQTSVCVGAKVILAKNGYYPVIPQGKSWESEWVKLRNAERDNLSEFTRVTRPNSVYTNLKRHFDNGFDMKAFLKENPESPVARLVNGDRGEIVDFYENVPVIEVVRSSEQSFWIDRHPFEVDSIRILYLPQGIKRQRWVPSDGEETKAFSDISDDDRSWYNRRGQPMVLVTTAHLVIWPLLHGWAVTVNRCQGLTIEQKIVIRSDYPMAKFPGFFYVALTRARIAEQVSIEGYRGFTQSQQGLAFYSGALIVVPDPNAEQIFCKLFEDLIEHEERNDQGGSQEESGETVCDEVKIHAEGTVEKSFLCQTETFFDVKYQFENSIRPILDQAINLSRPEIMYPRRRIHGFLGCLENWIESRKSKRLKVDQ